MDISGAKLPVKSPHGGTIRWRPRRWYDRLMNISVRTTGGTWRLMGSKSVSTQFEPPQPNYRCEPPCNEPSHRNNRARPRWHAPSWNISRCELPVVRAASWNYRCEALMERISIQAASL
ncbi:hypothetical protein AVEN_251328-1 [Araneus ventricosus]|uniref:Uncharacterized protein n=1 Tax=Araneus ventricosus TaxID=182803 RepID=A0A4Y2RHM9_ARAVE|nr:hypothetical protein AVEN_251328-1 [Araneus ventricosus]